MKPNVFVMLFVTGKVGDLASRSGPPPSARSCRGWRVAAACGGARPLCQTGPPLPGCVSELHRSTPWRQPGSVGSTVVFGRSQPGGWCSWNQRHPTLPRTAPQRGTQPRGRGASSETQRKPTGRTAMSSSCFPWGAFVLS